MEEKLIIISYQDEILDFFVDVYSPSKIWRYCERNGLKLESDILEFEAFVFVNVDFK